MMRYALVTLSSDRDNIAPYMPSNYEEIHIEAHPDRDGWRLAVIAGRDSHGWTLDGYVIPRLQSGMYFAEEIDLSHPIMKHVAD